MWPNWAKRWLRENWSSSTGELGAMLCGGNKGDVVRFKGLGTLAGICFQLRDDILDYTAEDGVGEGTLGKPVGQDMREGKLRYSLLEKVQPAMKTFVR